MQKYPKYSLCPIATFIAIAIAFPATAKTPEEVGQIACNVSVQINPTGGGGDGSLTRVGFLQREE